ncbi:class III lanthipeptide [Shouchella clausii]|jgi:hypothetical protein|nr:class III lanthipeptide [Shouchella clausii]SPU19004.1 Uncharacterised protein [Niallia circulans]MBU8595449.1 class III lanthipeptide [Shouchella clausii]MCM3548846.1 class III lanthipeptide [Shouchella clausii]MCR1286777.1 class III lanthipeptide [Shouchella clausii]MCY1103496.1 class III lanthipeptide [Shouchella clausii]
MNQVLELQKLSYNEESGQPAVDKTPTTFTTTTTITTLSTVSNNC